MPYRELATINKIKIDDLSPEGIVAQKNKLPTKCLGWFDSWREKRLTKKIRNFLIENDFNLYSFRYREKNIDILWHCLTKFYNADWDITIDYYKTFKNVYNSDNTESADYWFFQNCGPYHTFDIKFKKRDI